MRNELFTAMEIFVTCCVHVNEAVYEMLICLGAAGVTQALQEAGIGGESPNNSDAKVRDDSTLGS